MKTPRARVGSDAYEHGASPSDIDAVVAGTHGDPFALLGIQEQGDALWARCFIPHAETVSAYTLKDSRPATSSAATMPASSRASFPSASASR